MNTAQNGSFAELPHIMEGLDQYYMVTRTDADGLITYANQNFLTISKWTPRRVLGKAFWQMFPEDEQSQNKAHMIWKQMKDGKSYFGTVQKLSKRGDSYYVKMLSVPVTDEDGNLQSVSIIELDVSEDVHLREQLQSVAYVDHETGLMSRHRLESLINEYIEENRHFSYVYITIDHYYTLKDLQTYGSETILVQEFTNRLKRFFQDDPIARVGVNQFVVLTSYGSWFVQGFLDFLKEQPIYIDSRAVVLSVSGGIVRYPEDQKTYTHLVKAALSATKQITEMGGGNIVSLSAESHAVLSRRSIIDKKMLTAIDDHQLTVVYLPQMEIASGKTVAYEALVRWEDDELKTIMPDELIPIAEENGMIHKIGAFVLEEAAGLSARLSQTEDDITISVNTSVREFSDKEMTGNLISILRKTQCPPNKLQLEITEKFALLAEQEHSIIAQMKRLNSEGVQFTLDDFGTGYSSFRYMQALPLTKVKIDKEFIQSLLTIPKTQQLVEGMIHLSKSLGYYVVAEGVETEEQFHLLKEMGIDAVQGYFIGKPLTEEEVLTAHSRG